MIYGGAVVLTVVPYFALMSVASLTASNRWNSALGFTASNDDREPNRFGAVVGPATGHEFRTAV